MVWNDPRVVLPGPDEDYQGREVCALFNEDTLTLIDFTDKKNPELLARESYYGFVYSHQGWLTEDHRFILLDGMYSMCVRACVLCSYIFVLPFPIPPLRSVDECDELVNQDPNGESPTAGTFPTARYDAFNVNWAGATPDVF